LSDGEPTLPEGISLDWPPHVRNEIHYVGRFLDDDELLIEVEDARRLHDGALFVTDRQIVFLSTSAQREHWLVAVPLDEIGSVEAVSAHRPVLRLGLARQYDEEDGIRFEILRGGFERAMQLGSSIERALGRRRAGMGITDPARSPRGGRPADVVVEVAAAPEVARYVKNAEGRVFVRCQSRGLADVAVQAGLVWRERVAWAPYDVNDFPLFLSEDLLWVGRLELSYVPFGESRIIARIQRIGGEPTELDSRIASIGLIPIDGHDDPDRRIELDTPLEVVPPPEPELRLEIGAAAVRYIRRRGGRLYLWSRPSGLWHVLEVGTRRPPNVTFERFEASDEVEVFATPHVLSWPTVAVRRKSWPARGLIGLTGFELPGKRAGFPS
jgi:hypothetical protein